MAYMQQRHFRQMWRRNIHVATRKMLLPLFCISTPYLSSSDCLVVTLNFYTVRMFLCAVRYFVNKKTVSCKHVSTFLLRKYEVISQLRHNYAKGPFCMARLNYNRQSNSYRSKHKSSLNWWKIKTILVKQHSENLHFTLITVKLYTLSNLHTYLTTFVD